MKNSTGWKKFLNLCTSTKDEKTMEAILDLFLTADEKTDLADRALIVRELLAEKLTQREIAGKLGVSISKITRGSNALKEAKPQLIQTVKKLVEK